MNEFTYVCMYLCVSNGLNVSIYAYKTSIKCDKSVKSWEKSNYVMNV